MHIFESQTIGYVIHTLAVPIVTKSFGCNHIVYFLLRSQSQTVHVGLGQHNTHQVVAVASKANHFHGRLWEEIVVKGYGIQSFLPSRIDRSSFFNNRCVAVTIIYLCFGTLCYLGAKLSSKYMLRIVLPQIRCLSPLFYELLLLLVYFPVCWASFAAFSIATCSKACCRVACDDGRPNERRASDRKSVV